MDLDRDSLWRNFDRITNKGICYLGFVITIKKIFSKDLMNFWENANLVFDENLHANIWKISL